MANNAVGTAAVIDLAVTTAKLAALAVTEEKLAGEAVSAAKIKALAVTAAKLAAEAVETGKIANLAVTAAKLAASAVEEAKIKDGAVTSRKLKPTANVKASSAKVVFTGETQDVPGASLNITPSVASTLLVTTAFNLLINDTEGKGITALGILDVDGVGQEIKVVYTIIGGVGDNQVSQATLSEVYAIPLSAAAHTIKLQVRSEGTGTGECTDARFLYMLIAS